MAAITLRYFAAARAAAGLDQETIDCETPEAAFTAVSRAHGSDLQRIIDISSFLLDGQSLGRERIGDPVVGSVTIDVLPPFAGG